MSDMGAERGVVPPWFRKCGQRETRVRVWMISASVGAEREAEDVGEAEVEDVENGAMLKRTVPGKRVGSCGMAMRRERRSLAGIVSSSSVSSDMDPESSSRSRKRARIREDFPLEHDVRGRIRNCSAAMLNLPSCSATHSNLLPR